MCFLFNCCKIVETKNDEIDLEKENEDNALDRLNEYNDFVKIGKGATSTIFTVTNKKKKFICKSIRRDELRKGLREVKILKQFNSRYLPKLKESIKIHTKLFIIMEYEEAIDLHYYFFENDSIMKKTTDFDRIVIIKQMIKSLIALHEYNFVHLDLKLENFIINSKNQVKLIDFGTTHSYYVNEVKLNTIIGTRGYSAPEIYRSAYHFSSDIWSLGICIWMILFKKHCFNHDNIKRNYTLQNFPYEEFQYPSLQHKEIMKNANKKTKLFFEMIFQLFPYDRCSLEYLNFFDMRCFISDAK